MANASLFNQLPSRALSPFQTHVHIPCSSSLWTAASATEWKALLLKEIPRPLSKTLKDCLSESRQDASRVVGSLSRDLDFARYIILHNLMAIGWDLNRRNLVGKVTVKTWAHVQRPRRDHLRSSIVSILLDGSDFSLASCFDRVSCRSTGGPAHGADTYEQITLHVCHLGLEHQLVGSL